MATLYRYFKDLWKLAAISLVLAAINQIFTLLDPLILRHIIDSYANRNREYSSPQCIRGVGLLLAAAVGVALVSRIAKNFQDYFVNVITQKVGARIYTDGVRHSLDLPYTLFEDQRSGETLGKLQRVRSDVEKFIALLVNMVFTTLIGLAFVTIYAAKVHWSIAPAYLLTVPLLGSLSSLLSRKVKSVQKRIVTEQKPEHPVALPSLETLEFDRVSFQHQSASSPALSEISFRVARGETIAFVGPSGAGKTSLVKLLVGLYRPKSGHIFYNGTPEDQVAIEDLRERIGFVTQDTQLFSGSIRENLQFVRPDATDEECLEVLRQAAVEGLLLRANHGLDSKIGEGGVKVSGGEKQRLSIARALLRRPQLLVFDEATSSLDSLTEEEISETIRDVAVRRDAITILIAHRLSTILHADCIYVLERGRIVESGRHEDLLASKGLYSAMWRQQVGEGREKLLNPA